MISTSGSKLLQDDAIKTLSTCLSGNPMTEYSEASVLSGISIANETDMIKAAEIISNQFVRRSLQGRSQGE